MKSHAEHKASEREAHCDHDDAMRDTMLEKVTRNIFFMSLIPVDYSNVLPYVRTFEP